MGDTQNKRRSAKTSRTPKKAERIEEERLSSEWLAQGKICHALHLTLYHSENL